jgi:hypothetical protein
VIEGWLRGGWEVVEGWLRGLVPAQTVADCSTEANNLIIILNISEVRMVPCDFRLNHGLMGSLHWAGSNVELICGQ